MNDFDEDKWTLEQRALDGRIAADVEGLAGSRWAQEQAGGTPEAWVGASQDTARAIRAQVARLTHAGRRAHWDAELTRLGLPRPPEPKAKSTVSADELLGVAEKPKAGGAGKNG